MELFIFSRLFPAAILLAGVPLIIGCQTGAPPGGAGCEPRPGMTAAELVRCGCQMTSSSGAALVTEGGAPSRAVTMAKYVCPLGSAGLATVSVVDGVAREVY